MSVDRSDLEIAIGHTFTLGELLTRSLTHSSHRGESGLERKPEADNEQLEFLGDAVLGMVVSEHVIRTCPEFDEGRLSTVKARLVNRAHLADVARTLRLGSHLLMGKAEDSTGGRDKPSLLANALEALLAAVYLDSGLETVRKVILDHIVGSADVRELAVEAPNNVKVALEMLARTRGLARPEYSTRPENRGHPPVFVAEVKIGAQWCARGRGGSKKVAELEAAREMVGLLEKGPGQATD